MELKEGMYVRTKYGVSQYKQHKIIGSEDITGILCKDGSRVIFVNIEDISKVSYNIIDLIEVGDYVNGHRVNYISRDRDYFNLSFGDENYILKSSINDGLCWVAKKDIKSIVTKEQFSQMEYKVGD